LAILIVNAFGCINTSLTNVCILRLSFHTPPPSFLDFVSYVKIILALR
jgi:hypothetical protein